jgi:hypothetical protein
MHIEGQWERTLHRVELICLLFPYEVDLAYISFSEQLDLLE